MSTLSRLAETLIGSEIVRLGNAINARICQGEQIYNYTIGDFDPAIFPIPEALKRGIRDAYEAGYTNYPPADGIAVLKAAVLGFIADRQALQYEANEV